jgi:hypothetical protein
MTLDSFDTDFAEAFPDLLELHGESIVYHPFNGSQRTIDAIVNRNPSQPMPGVDGQLVIYNMTIRVLNDGTDGIESGAEFDSGGDTIDVARQANGTAENRPLGPIINDDGGVLTIGVN